MVRWRCSLLLVMLLLLPARICGRDDDEEEGRDNADEDGNDSEADEDDESDEVIVDKSENSDPGRRAPSLIPTPKTIPITRTTSRRPLECYVCAYKADSPMKSCLDPIKFRVHTMACPNIDDKCFTAVMSKGGSLEALVRGCRSGCLGSPETACCETNRCNSQAQALPVIAPQALAANKTTKSIPTTVLFFVTILLVLQTVVKVAFV